MAVLVFACLAPCAAPAHAEVREYTCVLSPRQVVPPVSGSRAAGAGKFRIDTDANTVSYWIVSTKLGSAETVAHIHGNFISSPGLNATIRATLPPGNPKVGVWSYTEDLETMILSGFSYADIHTTGESAGELRGQIVPFNAVLDGNQEVPTVVTPGKGWATFTIDPATHHLDYYIWYEGLTGAVTLAHTHGPALHAQSAGVKLGITVGASPMSGTLTYLAADERDILAGRWYVNLHTAANPGGEIRGQICPIVVPMDAAQMVPPVNEPGSAGFALVAIDTAANALSYDIHVDSVRAVPNGEHLHGYAPAGANAAAVVTISPGARRVGLWTYGAANEAEVLNGHAYVDAHTATHSSGEIRGQLMRLPGSSPLLGVGGMPRAEPGMPASPNPFVGHTVLAFRLARPGWVSMEVTEVSGRLARRIEPRWFESGLHAYDWDGRDAAGRALPAGLYFARIRMPDGETVTRVSRLR